LQISRVLSQYPQIGQNYAVFDYINLVFLSISKIEIVSISK